MRILCRTLLLLLVVASVVSAPASAAPNGPSCAVKVSEQGTGASLHARLQNLDRELQSDLWRVDRPAGGRGNPARWRRQVESFRRELDTLERGIDSFGGADAMLLRSKIRALHHLVGNLEIATSSEEAARSLPLPGTYPREVSAASAAKASAPTNDDCAGALVIGEGTAVGDTSQATPDGTASCGASLYAPDVWFKYVATEWSTVSIDTFGSGFDTVLSVHDGCPGTTANEIRCNDDAYGLQSAVSFYTYPGGEYWIRVSGFDRAAGPFELHLGHGGAISGTVSAEQTGDPLAGGRVEARDVNGYWVRSADADLQGEYQTSSLGAGSYYLTTEGFDGYLDELYDDQPCPRGVCDVRDGSPVAVSSSGSVTDVDFALGEGGAIEGLVTAAVDGDPISGAWVEIWNDSGDRVASAVSDDTGTYRVSGLATGTFFAVAESDGFTDELYDGMPCAGGAPWGCDVTGGTPIEVVVASTTSGIDFALDRLGVISGTVTHAVSGEPLAGVQVEIRRLDGSWVDYGYTGAAGSYTVGGLAAGTYVAVTDSYEYADEVYDDIPCPTDYYWDCDLSDATPLVVGLNTELADIDFALDRLGSISGTITETTTGEPIPNVGVEIWDADGEYVKSGWADSGGQYSVARLAAGSYFVTTDSYHADELYDDLPCEGGCDVTLGTPIAVSLGATTSGVDFSLARLGAIAGTVTDAATGQAVTGGRVQIWDAAGTRVADGWLDSGGQYSVPRLAAGTYFAVTDTYDHFDELHDDLPCEGGCDVTLGTPIAVSLGATTSGVDFALGRGGAISGTVKDAATGQPLASVPVLIWDAEGNVVKYGYSDSEGRYRVDALFSGTYFASTYNYSGYSDELYDDLPCVGGCDVTLGAPIAVSLGAATPAIDFALDRLGSITAEVIDAATGEPLSSVYVELWTSDGFWMTESYVDSTGQARFTGLAPGVYFASTYNYWGYADELYDDVLCQPEWDCSPTKGTAIPVQVSSETKILFVLLPSGPGIAGRVTGTGGQPLADVAVDVWDAAGARVASTVTVGTGEYFVGLGPGTYFVSTANASGFTDAVYDGRACTAGSAADGLCDPLQGTPVTVTGSGGQTIALGIDFVLEPGGMIFTDGFESGDLSAWLSP